MIDTTDTTATDTTAPPSPGQEDFAAKLKGTLMSELGESNAAPPPATATTEPPPGNEPTPAPAATDLNEPTTPAEPKPDEQGLPPGVIKQLAELRQERRELREKLRQATDAPPPADEPPADPTEPPVEPAAPAETGVETLEALETERRQLEDSEDFAEQHLSLVNHRPEAVERALRREGVTLTDEEGHEDFSEDRMVDFLLNVRQNARQKLKRELPAKETALRHQQQQRAAAEKAHPWLKDPDSEEYRLANQVLQTHPHIRQGKDWLNDLADMVAYQKWKQGQTAPAPSPAPPAAPPADPRSPVAATRHLEPARDPLPGGTAPAPRNVQPDGNTAELRQRLQQGDGRAAKDLLARELGAVMFR